MAVLVNAPPCLEFEDDHLLVVNKPAGVNTHSPNPYAGEGIYEWLKNREPRWARLGIIHRLDKVTSGLILFSKSELASRSLTAQFQSRSVHKTYHFLTAPKISKLEFSVKTSIQRLGDKYIAKPGGSAGDFAETRFKYVRSEGKYHLWQAQPHVDC